MMRMQRGFTLIELMIALLLGSLVVLAATQLFSANQQLFLTQQTTSRLMDDGQLVLRFIGNDLRKAGYSGGAVSEYDGVLFGGANGSADFNPSDRLAIRFSGERDCQGTASGVAVDVVNVYFVNGDGELMCSGSLSTGAVALVSGVEAFRIMYGLDTSKDGVLGPFRFLGAADAQGASRPLVAIRVAMMMAAGSSGLPVNEGRTWHVLDRDVSTAEDRMARRVFTSTFMLRNMDWEEL